MDYPVQFRWVWKSISGYIVVLVIFEVLNLWSESKEKALGNLVFYGIVALFVFARTILRRQFFKYEVGETFISFRQGIFSRKERHIPYGVIQNIIVRQDLFDRLFKLASIRLENAAQAGGKVSKVQLHRHRQKSEDVGVDGAKVIIPGLDIKDAELLKQLILRKMDENPIDDGQSGL